MSYAGLVPFLALLTLVVVLALVWLNIQQTMSQLNNSRAQRVGVRAGASGPKSATE